MKWLFTLLFIAISSLQAQTPKFTVGQSVKTTSTAYIRSSPFHGNTNINVIGTATPGTVGSIISGPATDTSSDGDMWVRWNVAFTSPLPSGWVAENYLTANGIVPPPPSPVVKSVVVTPSSASYQVGQTTQFIASALDSTGKVITGLPVTWASSNVNVATISPSGVTTAISAGSVTITAMISSIRGTATVTVTAPTPVPVVTTITVTPLNTNILVGVTAQFTAIARDQNGNVMPGQVFTWFSSNSVVATVNASGLATGVSSGSVTISAIAAGKTGFGSLTVAAPPPTGVTVTSVAVVPVGKVLNPTDMVQLFGVVSRSDGSLFPGVANLRWLSDNISAADVDGTGLVHAIGAGSAIITATDSASGLSGVSHITVSPTVSMRIKQIRPENFAVPSFTGTFAITFADSLGNRVGRAMCTVTP